MASPVPGTWSEFAPMVYGRMGFVLGSGTSRIVAVEGDGQERLETFDFTSLAWRWWEFGASFLSPVTGESINQMRGQFGAYFGVGGMTGDRLVVAGGTTGSRPAVATRVYDFSSAGAARLSFGPNIPTPRFAPAGTMDGPTLYVVGGRREDGTLSDSVEAYDAVNASWTSLPALPVPVAGAAAAMVGGRLVVFGGYDASGTARDVVQVYRADQGFWITDPSRSGIPKLPAARHSAACAVLAGKVYLVGGIVAGSVGATATGVVYDPTKGQWQPMPPMPTARALHAATVVSGRIVVAGGQDARGIAPRSVEAFTP